MTLEELEGRVEVLEDLVHQNTAAIDSLLNQLRQYMTLTQAYPMQQNISYNTSDIHVLFNMVNLLKTSIGLVNQVSKLIDVNILNIAKDDLLQWDGDRWTNIKPSKLGISGGSGSNISLESLSDVSISNKTNGQALVWSNADGKWINSTIESGGGGTSGGGLDVTAMWEELGKNSTNQIHPSHITGALTLSGLTVNGNSVLKSGNIQLNVNNSKVSVNGDINSTGEITAYSI